MSKKSNEQLKELLESYGSLEGIFHNHFNFELSDVKNLEKQIKILDSLSFDFTILRSCDDNFPEQMKYVGCSPVLYVRGDVSILNMSSMAVVGTRNLNDDEDKVAGKEVVKRLVDAGYAIVSGLALGCDTLAHTHALLNKGRTIAVLGTHLNKYYPKSNYGLQEKIGQDHLLVSQYPLGINHGPWMFRERNLTTVALSKDGVVVVRANDKSGTMNAVRHCVEQEKPLYVLANNFRNDYVWIEKYKESIKRVNRK